MNLGYTKNEMTRFFAKVKGVSEEVILPKRSTANSAAYDFFATEDIIVPAKGVSKILWLNVKAKMWPDEVLKLYIRSSLSTKYGIFLACSGIIDSDYFENEDNDGNIGVKFRNISDNDYLIEKGSKCCQGIFSKYLIVDNDDAFELRSGGFGSTGK
jgi:dUTP pyrophosphatase